MDNQSDTSSDEEQGLIHVQRKRKFLKDVGNEGSSLGSEQVKKRKAIKGKSFFLINDNKDNHLKVYLSDCLKINTGLTF